MTELFDIVDQNDQPTGKTTDKVAAHRDGILHRVAAILVFTDSGELLIQEHKSHGRLWDHSVGGHVQAGESYSAAAKRELDEELGLDLPLEEIKTGVPTLNIDPRPQYKNGKHFYGVYTCSVPSDWVHKETEEVDRLIAMPVAEVVKIMNSEPEKFLNGFFITLSTYLNSINSDLKIKAFGQNWGEL